MGYDLGCLPQAQHGGAGGDKESADNDPDEPDDGSPDNDPDGPHDGSPDNDPKPPHRSIADRYADLLAPLSARRRRGLIARLSVGYYEGWRPSRAEVAALVAQE